MDAPMVDTLTTADLLQDISSPERHRQVMQEMLSLCFGRQVSRFTLVKRGSCSLQDRNEHLRTERDIQSQPMVSDFYAPTQFQDGTLWNTPITQERVWSSSGLRPGTLSAWFCSLWGTSEKTLRDTSLRQEKGSRHVGFVHVHHVLSAGVT